MLFEGAEQATGVELDFHKLDGLNGVVPTVVQDFRTGDVLMLAYSSAESLRLTMQTGYSTFFSTSRQLIWHKGATSGNRLPVLEIRMNCESNSLLFLIDIGREQGACHTMDSMGLFRRSCFHKSLWSVRRLTKLF